MPAIETAPIGRVGRRGGRVRVGGGRQPLPAETAWEVVERRAATALLRVRLLGGPRTTRCARTWPPRGFRSSATRGTEGKASPRGEERLHLHAESVRFRHPISGETILIEAPPPEWAMIRA